MTEIDPYATAKFRLAESKRERPLRRASRGEPFGAVNLDAFDCLPALATVSLANAAEFEFSEATTSLERDGAFGIMLGSLLGLVVFRAQLHRPRRDGWTIAKRFARANGECASSRHVVVPRTPLIAWIEAILCIGSRLGLIGKSFAFREERRRVHDSIASTVVVAA